MLDFQADEKAKLLHSTAEITSALHEMLRSATTEVWLVSPYVSFDKLGNLKRDIVETLARKVQVHVIVRNEKTAEIERSAEELVARGLDLRCVEGLHAKAYWSEQVAVLTSLNLLASSMNSSIEVGIQVGPGRLHAEVRRFINEKVDVHAAEMPEVKRERERAQRERERLENEAARAAAREAERARQQAEAAAREAAMLAAKQAALEAARIVAAQTMREVAASVMAELPAPRSSAPRTVTTTARPTRKQEVVTGFCIRCKDELPLNPERPYCAEDYKSWARYENEDYEDAFCHGCGKNHRATMRKPLCRSCWQDMA